MLDDEQELTVVSRRVAPARQHTRSSLSTSLPLLLLLLLVCLFAVPLLASAQRLFFSQYSHNIERESLMIRKREWNDVVNHTTLVNVNGTMVEGWELEYIPRFAFDYTPLKRPLHILEVFNPGCFRVNLREYSIRVASYSESPAGAVWGTKVPFHNQDEAALGPNPNPIIIEPQSTFSVCSEPFPCIVYENVTSCEYFGPCQLVSPRLYAQMFQGRDAVGLFHHDVLIDIIGSTHGMRPLECGSCVNDVMPPPNCGTPCDKNFTRTGAPWFVAGVDAATYNHTLRRKASVTQGTTDWFHPNGRWVGNPVSSQWEVFPAWDGDALVGSHVCPTCLCPRGVQGIVQATCGTRGSDYALTSPAAAQSNFQATSSQIDCPLDCLSTPQTVSVIGSAGRYKASSSVCLAAIHSDVLQFRRDAFPDPAHTPQPTNIELAPTCIYSGTTSIPQYSGAWSELFPASHRPRGKPLIQFSSFTAISAQGTQAYTSHDTTCVGGAAGDPGAGFNVRLLNITICDVTNCGGPSRGYCNQVTGRCECLAPWFGGVCNQKACIYRSPVYSQNTNSSNSNQGWCNNGNCDTTPGSPTVGQCICWPGFEGEACLKHSCDSNTCNHQGGCNRDTGECACHLPYFGKDCQLQYCPRNCSGHGVCIHGASGSIKAGTCLCDERHVGADCSLKTCKDGCSSFGQCDYSTGQCRCIGSIPAGEPVPTECRFDACPTKVGGEECSGHGRCNYESRACTCKIGWRGLACDQPMGD